MKRLVLGCVALLATFAASGCIIESDDDPISLVYEDCDTDYDCESDADGCFVITTDDTFQERMCTNECIDDLDCLDEGLCEGGYCFQSCFDDFDCFHDGFVCEGGICIP